MYKFKEPKNNTIVSNKITVSDVVWAIRTINKFIEVREKFVELIKVLNRAGIDVSSFDFNNPMSMVQMLAMAQNAGVDADIEMLLSDLERIGEVNLDDVKKAGLILRRYVGLCKEVDNTIKVLSKVSGNAGDISAMANMFGLRTPRNIGSVSGGYDVEDISDINIREEEIEDIKKAINEYRKRRKRSNDSNANGSCESGEKEKN